MKITVNGNQKENIEGISIEYPYVMHFVDVNVAPVPWHWHEEVEFEYIMSGELEVTTINQTYRFKANEAFFKNTNVLCSMKAAKNEPTEILSHLFNEIFLGGHFKSIFQTKYITPLLQNKRIDILEIRGTTPRQKQILTKLKAVARLQKKERNEFQTRNLFSEIWLLLLDEVEDYERQNHSQKYQDPDRIQTMLSYIHQNYAEKITLEDIAASASISKRECTRCFRKSIQKTPIDYLLEYRIEKAESLLTGTSDSITDIALRTGFSNNAYFGKLFKAQKGLTPGAYRKKYQRQHSRYEIIEIE